MKDLVSHHDFRKSIALAWINPHIDTNPSQEIVISRKSQRDQEDVSVSSSVTMSSIQSIMRPTRGIKCKATAVNDASIASTSNLSRLRLDKTLDHMQDIGKENARCLLHRWVGFELEKNVYYCPTCNVNLCILCNRAWHTVPDLLSHKGALAKQYDRIRDKNTKLKS